MQRTITVEGKRIKIVSRQQTSMGNPTGFITKITTDDPNENERYFCSTLYENEARDKAFVQWVEKHGTKSEI